MKRKRIVFTVFMLMFAYGAGSCEDLNIQGHTVGLIKFIRPDVAIDHGGEKSVIFEDTRFLPGTGVEVSLGARATILLDNGVRVAADSATRIRVVDVDAMTLQSGRIFIDADEKEQLTLSVGDGKLSIIGSGVSIQAGEGKTVAYTYRGELTYSFPSGSGIVRAGESLTLAGGSVDVRPEELWTDWTGGMAEAGPRPMENPVSIGQIHARLPGAAGQARWPLIIRRHEVRVTVKGDLAVTETMQEFFNPSSQTMEGIYRLSIPQDAMLQRFAVDRGGRLVDGIIKERRTAKQAYTSHVYQGSTSDPALLEWTAPGSFKASIYPIKAGQTRTVAYRYAQWLKPSGKDGRVRSYVYPVGNETIAPQIGEFYFVADVSDAGTDIVQAGAGARTEKGRVVFAQSDFRPRSDFYIQMLDVTRDVEDKDVLMVKADYRGILDALKGERKESYAFTQFLLRGEEFELKPEKNLNISVAIDMSAATERHLVDLAMSFLDSLFGQLHEGDRIAVLAGDVDAQIVGSDKKELAKVTESVREAVMDGVGRHTIGGATDIGKLIMESASVSAKDPGGVVIYIGDGFPTVGELDIGSLKERLGRLPNPVRLYGIALGDEANLDLLAGLCSGRGMAARIENRVEAAETATRLLADSSTPVIENLKFEIDGGIERVYPAGMTTLKITEPVRIIGKLTGEKDPENVTVKGTVRGKPFTKQYSIKLDDITDFGDLRMRWAERRLITLMEEQEGPEGVIELGTRFGIITPYTSFYVPPEEESYDLPDAPDFEIFRQLEGGGAEMTLGQVIVTTLLFPYGCSSREREMEMEEMESANRFTKLVLEPREAAPSSGSDTRDEGGKAKRHKGEEGQMGEPDRDNNAEMDGMVGLKGPTDIPAAPDTAARKAQMESAVSESGILSALGSTGDSADDLMNGEDSTGLAGLGTIGHGGGGGTGSGYGRGAGGLKGNESAPTIPKVAAGKADVKGTLSKDVIKRVIKQHSNEVRYCYEKQLSQQPGLAGDVNVKFNISASGDVQLPMIESSTLGSTEAEVCIAMAVKRWKFPAPEGGGMVAVRYPFKLRPGDTTYAALQESSASVSPSLLTAADLEKLVTEKKSEKPAAQQTFYQKTKVTFTQETHVSTNTPIDLPQNVKACQEASLMPIEEKMQLWKERLAAGPSQRHIIQVFNEARKNCEIKTAKDRRAFARVALGLLGSVSARCGFYKNMKQYPSLATYIKTKILSALATPDQVRIAMEQCDAAVLLTMDEVDKMLEKRQNPDDRIIVLKKLINLYPGDMQLKIRLLGLLEDAGRKEEAGRFAAELRADPYATNEVRTRIGELYLRMGERHEAKRVLSEIVEFAPWSYHARRRLGDLYRAYGWYEDAYRQYETLAQMAPHDDAVNILLAEAAILAGRSDEGLRILEQVSQSEPSFEGKISPAEISRVMASLTLAQKRMKARGDGDEKLLKKLVERTRRAGVLRDAAAMKIVLKWDHPDASFNLAVKFPDSELMRPFKSAPSLGLEWVTEKGELPDDMLVQVHRKAGSVVKESKATLTIIMNEGEKNESITATEITLTDKKKPAKAWKLSPDGTLTEARVDKKEPL
ncbi:MAG: AgmX/PglI C-terminal domain-containing protein [Pseudomonadota bacterium]